MSILGGIAALSLVAESMQACEHESGHKPVGGRIVGSDNGKDKSRAVMPFKDRNAACECGSGKKRKKCCKGKESSGQI